ncbi:MAG: hypothetical protein HYX75_03825 [Acidobacteria bacterium]|nr:hypothetical protein [Acidobacteriota bacterium]
MSKAHTIFLSPQQREDLAQVFGFKTLDGIELTSDGQSVDELRRNLKVKAITTGGIDLQGVAGGCSHDYCDCGGA